MRCRRPMRASPDSTIAQSRRWPALSLLVWYGCFSAAVHLDRVTRAAGDGQLALPPLAHSPAICSRWPICDFVTYQVALALGWGRVTMVQSFSRA